MSAAPRPETSPRLEPFRLRGANFNLLVLRLLDPRPEAVVPAIGDQFRRAPGFLRFAPVVLGLGDLDVPANAVDFRGLIDGLRELSIVPIGTTGGTPELRNAAMAFGLPPIRSAGGKETEESAPEPAAAAPAEPAAPPPAPPPPEGMARPTMIVEQPVRAGQRVWAQGGDLVVTSTVNAGAEVIADGNIHVYGALRGRAIAGGGANAEARIFALNFDPELISIAGYYAVREGLTGAPIGKAVQVRLTGERMRFDPIG
ncbi:septum site-determining protein MinC [Roseomonas eburnea]|uniref:Probable septum site-determining protein MinC n=1 Tax=Neoroseomonas eburnea TaxID=1346889 RepID=A0A9X9X6E6_9PROT|nr:septum site-determining protein MinC [Neoroseomonas eburnea]MBR0679282.1 septum site-determining protein MinC [Neoroseomonas eburnea]